MAGWHGGCVSRPCLWTLPSSLLTLYLEDLEHDDQSQRHAAFQLISDASQRADNIGIDEFPLEWFVWFPPVGFKPD